MLGVGVTYSLPIPNQTYETADTLPSSSSSLLSQTSIPLEEEQAQLQEYQEEQYEFASGTCSFTVIGRDLADTITSILPSINKYSNYTEVHTSLTEENEIAGRPRENKRLTDNKNNSNNTNNTSTKTSNHKLEHLSSESELAANMSEHSQNNERREHRRERQRQRRAQEHRRNSSSSSSSSTRGSSHSQSNSDKLMAESREWEDCDSNVSDGDDDNDDSHMFNEHIMEEKVSCNSISIKPRDIMYADKKEDNKHVFVTSSSNNNSEIREGIVHGNNSSSNNHHSESTGTEISKFEEFKDKCHAHSHHRYQLSATAHIPYLTSHNAEKITLSTSNSTILPPPSLLEHKSNCNENDEESMSSKHCYTVEESDLYNVREAPSCTPPPESLQTTTVPTQPFTFEHANNIAITNSNIIINELNNDKKKNNTYTRMYTVEEHKREGECDEAQHKPQQQESQETEHLEYEEEEEEEEEQREHYLYSGENKKEEEVESFEKTKAIEESNHQIANRAYEESDNEELQESSLEYLEQEEEQELKKEMHDKEPCCDSNEAVHTPQHKQRITNYLHDSNNSNNNNNGKPIVPSLQLEMLVQAPEPPIQEMKYDKVIPLTDAHFAGVAITRFMTRMCKANVSEPVPSSDFHSHRLPPMSVKNYMERIVRHCNCSGEALLCGLVLLLKYSLYSNHPINIYNAHRLLLTSTVLGIKMRDEVYYSNVYYARIGGITPKEMNKLEVLFLSKLGWDVSVEAKHYGELRELLTFFVDPPIDDVLELFANTHFIRQVSCLHNDGKPESESQNSLEEGSSAQEELPPSTTSSCKLCTECIDRLQGHIAELVATKEVNSSSSSSSSTLLLETEIVNTNTNAEDTTELEQKKLKELEELEKEQKRKEELEMELEEYNSDDYDGFVQNAKIALSGVKVAAHSNNYTNKISSSSNNINDNNNNNIVSYRQRIRKWSETNNISLAQLIKCFRCHTWHESVIPWLSRFQEETFAYHEWKSNRERADWAAEEQKWEGYRAAEYAAALEASTRSSVNLSRWTSPQSLHKSTQLSHTSSVNQSAHVPLSYLEFQQQQQQQQQQNFFYAAHGQELYPSVNHFGGGNSSISAYCLNGNRPISYHTHLVNGQTLTYEASPTSLSASTSYHSYLQHQQSHPQQQSQQQHENSVGWSYMNKLSDGMLINAQNTSYSSIHADPNYFPCNHTISSNVNSNSNTQPMFGTLGVSEENYQAQIADQYDRFKNADGRASPMTINGSASTARYTNFRHNQRTSTPTHNSNNNNGNCKQQSNYMTSSDVAAAAAAAASATSGSSSINNNMCVNSNASNQTNRKQTHYFTGTAWRHGNQRVAVPTGLRSPYAQGKVYAHNEYNTNTTALTHNHNSKNNESTCFLTRAIDKESNSTQATTHSNASPHGLPPRPVYPVRTVTPGTGINVHAEPYYFSKKSSKTASTENKSVTSQQVVPVRSENDNFETNKDTGNVQSSAIIMDATNAIENQSLLNINNKNNNNNKTCRATIDNRMSQHHDEQQHVSHEFPAIPVYTCTTANSNNNDTNITNTTETSHQEVEQRSVHLSHSTLAQVDTRERSNDRSVNGETRSRPDVRIGKKRPKPAHYQDYYEEHVYRYTPKK